ncbi:MAG: RDD family protein [Actinomycetota bacterium]
MTDESAHQPESGDDQAAQQPPAQSQPSGAGAPADVATRFVARLIDGILLGVVYSALIVPFIVGAMFADVGGFGMFGGFGGGAFVSSIFWAVIGIGYFALMEANQGQTVGKMIMGLRVEGPDGGKASLEQTVKRNGWMALGIIPILGGLAQLAVAIYIAVTISNSITNTGWHDEFAGGTKVIRTK